MLSATRHRRRRETVRKSEPAIASKGQIFLTPRRAKAELSDKHEHYGAQIRRATIGQSLLPSTVCSQIRLIDEGPTTRS